MKVKVLLFGPVAAAAGREELELDVVPGTRIEDILVACREVCPAVPILSGSLALAVNAEWAAGGRILQEGDEIALIPPVSGG
jgi:molybdopterin converting factor small subunit